MDRRVIQAAAVAILVAGVPHFAYHLTTTEALSTGDNVASLTGLGLYFLVPVVLLYLVSDRVQRSTARPPPARARSTPARTIR